VAYIRISLKSPHPYFRFSGAMRSFGGVQSLDVSLILSDLSDNPYKSAKLCLESLSISRRSTYTPIIHTMATTYQDASFSSAIISCQTQSPLSISYTHYLLVPQTYSGHLINIPSIFNPFRSFPNDPNIPVDPDWEMGTSHTPIPRSQDPRTLQYSQTLECLQALQKSLGKLWNP
jgi:hypothetical protein